jgi:leucyl aminopeptidase (aminopeptidase T)
MLPAYPEAKRRALARNLLGNALRLTRGESVLIETWSETLPWAVTMSEEARALGALPLLSVQDEEAYWRGLEEAPATRAGRVGAHTWAALRASDAYVCLYGPMDTVREEALPASALRRLEASNHEMMRLIQKHAIRCIRWDLGRTNPVWARRYGVDLGTWRRELIEASLIDPRRMHREGSRIAERLKRGRELTVSDPNGTDLTLRLAHRRPRVDDGVIDAQDVRDGNVMMVMPAGVTSATVDEGFAEGSFVANSTGVVYALNQEVPLAPARWKFDGGRLTGVDHGPGAAPLQRVLRAMRHPKVPVGQISIGLNPLISSIPLCFDQGRGTITLEIGRNAMLGGRTRTPHLVAYADLHGGTLAVDGEPLVERGHLVAS